MTKRKKRKKSFCEDFDRFKLPPCAKFLGSNNPFVKDGRIIYRNNNRLYLFLSFNTKSNVGKTYNPMDPSTYSSTGVGNLQIELYFFIIGLFINEVQKGNIKDYENISIHEDDNADKFIKNVLDNEYNITTEFVPSLTYLISNASAVIPVFTGVIDISPINFYIILMLSRFYGDYGLLFSDNAYVTNDFINLALANTYVEFYKC